MAKKAYALSKQGFQKLKKGIISEGNRPRVHNGVVETGIVPAMMTGWQARVTTAITAADDTIPGQGEVVVQKLVDQHNPAEISVEDIRAEAPAMTVYSMHPIQIYEGSYVWIQQDPRAVMWVIQYQPIKSHISFVLAEDFTGATAKIHAPGAQFGTGLDNELENPTSEEFTLVNTALIGGWLFEGSNNDRGIAVHAPNLGRYHYVCIQLQCGD